MDATKLVRGLRHRLGSFFGNNRTRRPSQLRRSTRLQIELLEDRVVPYSFSLANNTGLNLAQNTLYVLGYSAASELVLQPSGTPGQLQWGSLPTSVTLPEATTNGSNTIAMTGLSSSTYVSVGDLVTGTGIPAGTTITAISATIMISQAATGTATNPLTFNVQTMVGGMATTGSNVITGLAPPPTTSNLRLGQSVTGQGITAGTTITQINSNSQITLSANASSATYSGQNPLTISEVLSGSTTNMSQSITLTGLTSSNAIAAGDPVSGTNISANTLVSHILNVTITLSNAGTATATNPLTFTASQAGTWSGDTISGISTSVLGVGYPVSGAGIPAGTTITQVNSATQITISSIAPSAGPVTVTFPPSSGIIPSFDITQFTSFDFDPTVQTNGLNGARLYFFVVPTTWPATASQASVAGYPTNPPGFPYAWSGTGFGVQQPNNPPNSPSFTSGYPPFAIVEPTVDPQSAGGGLHIDVQTVDGFSFPLSLTLFDSSSNQLGQVGQPVPATGISRADILSAYRQIFSVQVPNNPYAELLYGTSTDINGQYPGILNPGAYLANGANPGSPLNSIWNSTLNTLFTQITSLNMIGDDGDYYQGKPTTVNSNNVLEFIGYTDMAMTQTNGNKFHIYDPLTPDPLAPNYNLTAGYQVFANDGVFNDASTNVMITQNGNTVTTPTEVVLGLERDIVSALNRGIALLAPTGPTGRTAGDTSAYWGTETNWYPYVITDTDASHVQNQFSMFMHTATVNGVSVFTRPANAVMTASGSLMSQAYGFAYDESPVHGPANPPNVPSKFDPAPPTTSAVTITLGPWFSSNSPTVGLVMPNSGSTSGGTQVTITGTNFQGATVVHFGDQPVYAPHFTVHAMGTSIIVTSPAHAAGTVDVTVTTPSGTSATSPADQFTYVVGHVGPTVTGLSVTSGPTMGGTSVTISGTNFTGATAVRFGGTPAAAFTVISPISIMATSPAHAAGTVDISVTTPQGTSAASPADRFTYLAAPAADRIAFVQQPPFSFVNRFFPTTIVVQIVDSQGNPVAHRGEKITLSLLVPNGAVLSGLVTRFTDASGKAQFPRLRVNRPGSYQLLATRTGGGMGTPIDPGTSIIFDIARIANFTITVGTPAIPHSPIPVTVTYPDPHYRGTVQFFDFHKLRGRWHPVPGALVNTQPITSFTYTFGSADVVAGAVQHTFQLEVPFAGLHRLLVRDLLTHLSGRRDFLVGGA